MPKSRARFASTCPVLDNHGQAFNLTKMERGLIFDTQNRWRKMRCLAGCLLLMLAGCDAPDPLDALPQGETGRVVRIIDGDALVLDTGLTVRLVGLEAPAPKRRNREGQPYAEEATRLLEDLSMGRRVRLIYPGLTRDRYDRALAYVKTEDALGPELWLNEEVLRRGAARARFYPDTSRLGERLLAAEAEARDKQTGLWAFSTYDIIPATDILNDTRGFHIITGTPGAILPPENDRSICTRRLNGTAIIAEIGAGAATLCEPRAPHQATRLRGYIRDGKIEITHGLNAEPL